MPRDAVLSGALAGTHPWISAPSVEWSTSAIAINAEIITRRWRSALSIRHIAAALGQDRETVGEALRTLECHGITQYTRRYGWRVCGRNVNRGPIAEISVAVDVARRHALGEWRYRALDGTLADRPMPSLALLARQYQVNTDTVLNALAEARFVLPWLGLAALPPATPPTESSEAWVATGEAGLTRHLRGRPGPGDTVRALSRTYALSQGDLRDEMKAAAWPPRESARDPVQLSDRRPAVIALAWVELEVADVIGQVSSSTLPPSPDTAPT